MILYTKVDYTKQARSLTWLDNFCFSLHGRGLLCYVKFVGDGILGHRIDFITKKKLVFVWWKDLKKMP